MNTIKNCSNGDEGRCIEFVPCEMGGGWAIPLTDAADERLSDFFGEYGSEIPAVGNSYGYIVEPQQFADLAQYLRERGLAWEVE